MTLAGAGRLLESDLATKILRAEDLIHDSRTWWRFSSLIWTKTLPLGAAVARKQEAVAQICQVRVQSQFPGIAIGLHHLRLARHVRIVVVRHIAFADERLKVGAEFHPVRRVDVDHLHLAAEALVVQQRVHHDERVAEDQAVHPVVPVFVGAQRSGRRWRLGVAEQVEHVRLAFRVVERLDNRLGGEPLMHEQGQCGHVKREPLGLAGPVQERLTQVFELFGGGLSLSDGRAGRF